jgi:ribosome-binding factor A
MAFNRKAAPMHNIRKQKVESQLKREISMLIMRELKDPRTNKLISVTNVSLTNDIRAAHVYVSVMGDEKDKKGAMAGLKSAAGFIRKEIGEIIQLRYTPEIIFELDETIDEQVRVERLFKTIEEQRAKNDKE